MPSEQQVVTGGVDTHNKDVHVAAVIDERGKVLEAASFSATAKGYRELLTWLGSFDELVKVAVEGTGAYGAGLARARVSVWSGPSSTGPAEAGEASP